MSKRNSHSSIHIIDENINISDTNPPTLSSIGFCKVKMIERSDLRSRIVGHTVTRGGYSYAVSSTAHTTAEGLVHKAVEYMAGKLHTFGILNFNIFRTTLIRNFSGMRESCDLSDKFLLQKTTKTTQKRRREEKKKKRRSDQEVTSSSTYTTSRYYIYGQWPYMIS